MCSICDFQWKTPKEYDKCPDCGSEEIFQIESPETITQNKTETLSIRRSYGGNGQGAGPPRVCKCQKCGYESPKTRGVPCRNDKCPECGAPLCGAE